TPLAFLFFSRRLPLPSSSALFPYTTLFRSRGWYGVRKRQRPNPHTASASTPRREPEHHPTLPRHRRRTTLRTPCAVDTRRRPSRSEEHTSELQSRFDLVCRLLLEKKKPPTG